MARLIVAVALLLSIGMAMQASAGDWKDCAQEPAACQRLADQGSVGAQYALGLMYYVGYNIPPDYPKAMKWFLRAADQRDVGAQGILGVMYERGEGVPTDFVQAMMWYDLAAAQGGAGDLRDRLAAKMTPVQLGQAKALAAAWKPTTGQ